MPKLTKEELVNIIKNSFTKKPLCYLLNLIKPKKCMNEASCEDNHELSVHFNFEKFPPKEDADISRYEKALNYAFDDSKNSNIRNIALSGPFGAGKSSIIISYAKKYDKKFIIVSLAHFGNEKGKETLPVIEKKIVNSLVQQIPVKQIPDSKFQIKHDNKNSAIKFSSYILSIAAFALFLSNITEIKKALDLYLPVISHYTLPILGIGLFIWAAASLGIGIYILFRHQLQGRLISKITYKGDEIEFSDDKESYFDKHLDEILYLLVNAECDGFVFEDLDRFSDFKVELYEHLRELCGLANLRLQNQSIRKKKKTDDNNRKPIRFIYLMSETIFIEEEKTKFFDFIIPIIPIVDTFNSYIYLKDFLSETNLFNSKNDNFIRGLSLYLKDMRTVMNIANEFKIYAYKKADIHRDASQLLAFIAYKNIFPRDFADLQVDKGYVFTIFNKKRILREKRSSAIKKDIDDLKLAKKEPLDDLNELEAVRANREKNLYSDKYNKNYNIWIEKDYLSRKNAIERKLSNNFLDQSIADKNKELIQINSKKLYKLIDSTNREELYAIVIDEKPLKLLPQYKFICFLIEGGYLDEDTYRSYISVFREGGISVKDWNFISAVKSSNAVDANQIPDDVSSVFEYLDDSDFLRSSTKNYSLIDYILKEKKENCIKSFILQLKTNNDLNFVGEFYNYSENRDIFVEKIIENWDGALDVFIKSLDLPEAKMEADVVQKIVLSAIINSSDKFIDTDTYTDNIAIYFSENAQLLICDNKDVDKVIKVFKNIGVSFTDLENQICIGELFDEIYKKDIYELNIANIKTLLNKIYKKPNVKSTNLLTPLFTDETQQLYNYVYNNLEYVVELQLDDVNEIDEDEKTVIKVLNSNLNDEIARRYIHAITCKVSDITRIEDKNLWKEIISNSAIKATWFNIFSFFKEFGLTDSLITFINSVIRETDFDEVNTDDDVITDFWKQAYCNKSFSDAAYIKICNTFGRVIDVFNVAGMEDEKITCLLRQNLLKVNANILNVFRSSYKKYVVEYICTDIDGYISIIQPNSFMMDEALGVFDNPAITTDKKIALLKKAQQVKIQLKEKRYEDEFTSYILKNHFDKTELGYLVEEYEVYSSTVQNEIYEHAKASVNVLISCDKIPEFFLEKYFSDEAVSPSDKVTVFDAVIDKIDGATASKLLNLANEPIIAKVFQEGRRLSVVPNDAIHKAWLDVLEDHNCIEGYDSTEDGYRIRKISKSKIKQSSKQLFEIT